MIAVFAKNKTALVESGFHLSPASKFVVVKGCNCIRGIRFDSIILMYDWHENKDVSKAVGMLKNWQPHLFEKPVTLKGWES